jgi:hypothetical protein
MKQNKLHLTYPFLSKAQTPENPIYLFAISGAEKILALGAAGGKISLMIYVKYKMGATAHNRTVHAWPTAWPAYLAALPSRGSLHPQFAGPGNAGHLLIRAAHTP